MFSICIQKREKLADFSIPKATFVCVCYSFFCFSMCTFVCLITQENNALNPCLCRYDFRAIHSHLDSPKLNCSSPLQYVCVRTYYKFCPNISHYFNGEQAYFKQTNLIQYILFLYSCKLHFLFYFQEHIVEREELSLSQEHIIKIETLNFYQLLFVHYEVH